MTNPFIVLFTFLLIFSTTNSVWSQATYVAERREMALFGTIDLSNEPNLKWSTARGAEPGFFSLYDDARFIQYSDRYSIDGYLKKVGNGAFTFPIGDGIELRTLEMSKPDRITDSYAAAWIGGDPGIHPDPTQPHAGLHPTRQVRSPIVSVSAIGQWDWLTGASGILGDQTTGTGAGIRITVSTPDLSRFADKNELRLVGWNGSRWVDLSGRPAASGNISNSKLTGTMIPGITAIGIGKIRSTQMVLFPNPVSDRSTIQLRVTTDYTGQAWLQIYNSIGQQLSSVSVNCVSGVNTFPISIGVLEAGTYVVELKDIGGDQLNATSQFIKL